MIRLAHVSNSMTFSLSRFPEKTRSIQAMRTPFMMLCEGNERANSLSPPELLAMLDVLRVKYIYHEWLWWHRQRKCTVASFNVLIWNQNLRQGQQPLQYWKDTVHESDLSIMARDIRNLTFDVLVSTCHLWKVYWLWRSMWEGNHV